MTKCKLNTTNLTHMLGTSWFLWVSCAAFAGLIHAGTAVIRLGSLWPTPQMIDFASYYAGAWALRLHTSPYAWSNETLAFLNHVGLNSVPPVHNSPPIWPWLLQPLTFVPFPTAVMIWLLLLLILSILAHIALIRLAGYTEWCVIVITLPITLTFGPLFLNISLGQNGIFLLFSVLLLGEMLTQPRLHFQAVVFWLIAVSAKLYPLLWIGCLPFIQRWHTFALLSTCGIGIFVLIALLHPELNAGYWLAFLPNQTKLFSNKVNIDDQSLSAFLTRIGKTNSFVFPGLSLHEQHTVAWRWPWEFSVLTIHSVAFTLVVLLASWLVISWLRNGKQAPSAILYSLVLFSLLPLPHMERYNHILALPAMAWLWAQDGPYRHICIGAYCLFGLSRLNHAWVIWLPPPLGPIASGFGLFGVIVLLVGVIMNLMQRPSSSLKAVVVPSRVLRVIMNLMQRSYRR